MPDLITVVRNDDFELFLNGGRRERMDAEQRLVDLSAKRIVRVGLADRFDAAQTAFLARDLVYVSRDIMRTLYDALKAALYIPVSSEVPRGAQTWVYRMWDERGKAAVGHRSADDPPRADVSAAEFAFKCVDVLGAYGYTTEELEAAAFANMPLSREKADACARMIARGLDELARIGYAPGGIFGFFNNPNVPVVTLTNGEWLTATADEICADFAQIEQAGIANARDNFSMDTLLLPTAFEGRLASLQRSVGSDTTVKQWLLANSRMIKTIDRWIALDDATGDDVGVSDPPQGIAYAKRPEVVRWDIPVTYDEMAPQLVNFEYVVPAFGRSAGVTFKQPKAAVYIENLD